VDMDQSDNVVTTYLVTSTGKIAQNTAANTAALAGAVVQTNGSDNRLCSVAMDGALGCTPWKFPDLADNNNLLPSQPGNELLAAARQAQPQALVPLGDPMCRVQGQPSLAKVNAYRVGVNQPVAQTAAAADTTVFCQNMYYTAPLRMLNNQAVLLNAPSAAACAANSLYTFLAQRFVMAFGPMGLACTSLLNVQPPISVTVDGNNVAITATITPPVKPPGVTVVATTTTATTATVTATTLKAPAPKTVANFFLLLLVAALMFVY